MRPFVSRPPWQRRLATGISALFAWSTVLAVPAQALAQPVKTKNPSVRSLTPLEMQRILGSHAVAVSAASGSTYPWEASFGSANTGNGNKLTQIPLTGWTARGGMGVAFTLAHNSQATHNSELGQKWTHSFDLFHVTTPNSNATSVTDANSHATTATFDNDNRPLVVTRANADAITYVYDATGKKGLLSTKTDGNSHTTTFFYTSRNQPSSTTYPDSTTESWTYDAAGNCLTTTDGNGHTITNGFDHRGLLTSVSSPLGTGISYTFDVAGQKTAMMSPPGV